MNDKDKKPSSGTLFYSLLMTGLVIWISFGIYKIFGKGETDVILFVMLSFIIFILSSIRYNQKN
jgi:hypothetical protein